MENHVKAIIVYPKNDRIYHYWINGSSEKRSMLKKSMLKFCKELCEAESFNIDRCINEILPFAIFVETGEFVELDELPAEQIPSGTRLFPHRKSVYNRTLDLNKTKKVSPEKRFNIWEKFNKHLDGKKNEHFAKQKKL